MPRITAKFNDIKFQPRSKTKADIDRVIRRAYYNAIRDFVRVAATNVPVVTGMAKGSLVPLAESVNVELDIGGTPRDGKGPELGASQATQPPYIRKQGNNYVFLFQSRVFHYTLRDLNALPIGTKTQKVTPWRSFEFGMAAFERRFIQYINRNLSRVLAKALNAKITAGHVAAPVNIGNYTNEEEDDAPF